MKQYIFVDHLGGRHLVRASELGAAFQYADMNYRHDMPLWYYWIEISPQVYKLGERK